MGLAPTALWFPPLIEMLIARSIVYMAFENIVGARLRAALDGGVRLRAGARVRLFRSSCASRCSLPARTWSPRCWRSTWASSWGSSSCSPWRCRSWRGSSGGFPSGSVPILLSALVAHTAWHWMTERGSTLRQYRFEWPALDVAFAGGRDAGLMLVLIVAGAAWLMLGLVRRLARVATARERRLGPAVAGLVAVVRACCRSPGRRGRSSAHGLNPLHAEPACTPRSRRPEGKTSTRCTA